MKRRETRERFFSIVNRLSKLPMLSSARPDKPGNVLPQLFADFFESKVRNIRNAIDDQPHPVEYSPACTNQHPTPVVLHQFTHTTDEEVHGILRECNATTCDLDPAPTDLIKQCAATLVPVISLIANQSFSDG